MKDVRVALCLRASAMATPVSRLEGGKLCLELGNWNEFLRLEGMKRWKITKEGSRT